MRHISVYKKYNHYLKTFATIQKLNNITLNQFEFIKKRTHLKSKPFKITIDPGNFCNLRCPGCHTGIKHPEMISPSFLKTEHYKIIFNQISDNAIVVGRYGSYDSFDIPFVYSAILELVEKHPNMYFLFMNTKEFATHKRIVYLPRTTDLYVKRKFINTCDVMLHSRSRG